MPAILILPDCPVQACGWQGAGAGAGPRGWELELGLGGAGGVGVVVVVLAAEERSISRRGSRTRRNRVKARGERSRMLCCVDDNKVTIIIICMLANIEN